MLINNKTMVMMFTTLTVFTLSSSANEPIDYFEKPQGDPINEFILPVNTSNQRLPSDIIENETDSKDSPVQFIFDSLKSSVPKGGSKVPTAITVDSYGMPQNQVAPPANTFNQSLRASYKPVQEFDLKPGENIAVAVAAGLMNRIKTNFKMVAVRTSDEDSIIEASDGYIYITINSMSPVGLMIYEEGMPETAVSLVLQPDNSPPAMVDVEVELTQTQKFMSAERKRERDRLEKIEELAKMKESSSSTTSYVKRIKEMLTPIAQNGIPKGFTETSEIPASMERPCSVAIRQKTAQRLVGSREYVDVVVMYNHTNYDYQIKEEQCLSRDTLAVALVDQSILPPGYSTEVYIVRDKLYREKQEKSNRRRQYSASELGLTKGD